jgi:hypothetical protein
MGVIAPFFLSQFSEFFLLIQVNLFLVFPTSLKLPLKNKATMIEECSKIPEIPMSYIIYV